MMPSAVRWVLLFVLGGAAATLGDRNHVAWDVLSYPDHAFRPFAPGAQPWWVFPLMGSSALSFAAGYRFFPASVREPPIPWKEVWVPGTWFLATYLLTGPLARWPVALAVGLAAAFVVRVWREPGHAKWVVPVLATVIGPIVEAAISGAGLFEYDHAELVLVPVWLPPLYLHVGLAGRAVARAMG